MKLYRVTYSGEAYVLAESMDEAECVIDREINDSTSIGLNLDADGPVIDIEDVGDWAWRDLEPFSQRPAPEFAGKTIREILESK